MIKPRKGVYWVKAITREFISALAQKPVTKDSRIPFTFGEPFANKEIDYPEIIVGKLDEPKKIPVDGVMEDYNSRMEAIRT